MLLPCFCFPSCSCILRKPLRAKKFCAVLCNLQKCWSSLCMSFWIFWSAMVEEFLMQGWSRIVFLSLSESVTKLSLHGNKNYRWSKAATYFFWIVKSDFRPFPTHEIMKPWRLLRVTCGASGHVGCHTVTMLSPKGPIPLLSPKDVGLLLLLHSSFRVQHLAIKCDRLSMVMVVPTTSLCKCGYVGSGRGWERLECSLQLVHMLHGNLFAFAGCEVLGMGRYLH